MHPTLEATMAPSSRPPTNLSTQAPANPQPHGARTDAPTLFSPPLCSQASQRRAHPTEKKTFADKLTNISHYVGNGGVLDTSIGVCTLIITVPGNGDEVRISGMDPATTLHNGDTVNLPTNTSIAWHATVSSLDGPLLSFDVGTCSIPLDTSASVCTLPIAVPVNGKFVTI